MSPLFWSYFCQLLINLKVVCCILCVFVGRKISKCKTYIQMLPKFVETYNVIKYLVLCVSTIFLDNSYNCYNFISLISLHNEQPFLYSEKFIFSQFPNLKKQLFIQTSSPALWKISSICTITFVPCCHLQNYSVGK